MREFFQRIEDGSVVAVEIDMNAFGYSNRFSWLFSVFIKFDSVDTNEESFEEFLEAKEALIISLELDEKAKYVGSRMLDGWSEIYFYAADSKSLNSEVTKMLSPSNYVFESSVVKDTKWDFHHKNLVPSELEECHIQSEKIIFMLEEEEDDLEVVRVVEHYISFELPTQKNRFINTLELEGFKIKDEISSEEFENGIALISEHKVTSEAVKEIVETLYKEIKKSQGFYEGWSTTLANES